MTITPPTLDTTKDESIRVEWFLHALLPDHDGDGHYIAPIRDSDDVFALVAEVEPCLRARATWWVEPYVNDMRNWRT